MTIDPKAAELAKALADAVAAQQTEEYQELERAAKEKLCIDREAEVASLALMSHYQTMMAEKGPVHSSHCAVYNAPAYEPGPCDCGASVLFDPPSDPAHYDLPTDDETTTAKPSNGLAE